MDELILFLRRQQEWSEDTFGPGYSVDRVLDHLRKAEGIGRFMEMDGYGRPQEVHPVAGLKKLWNDLHGDDAWARNDWVFVYSLSSLVEID